jgi:hypothetical protein
LIVPIELHPATAKEATTATSREGIGDMLILLCESGALWAETQARHPFRRLKRHVV